MGLIAALLLSNCKSQEERDAQATADVARYRATLLSSKPEDYDIRGHHDVWGVVVDRAEGRVTFTSTALVNGDAGFFFSNGRGRLGGRGYETAEVRYAAKSLCLTAGDFVEATTPKAKFSPPGPDERQFLLLTPSGVRGATVSEEQLINGHALSKFFWAVVDFEDALRQSLKKSSSTSD